MTGKIKIPLFIAFLAFLSSVSFGQQTLEIKPYAGYNISLGDFSQFSKNGAVVGTSADYFFTPNFGLGIDVNSQLNKFSNPSNFSRIPDLYDTDYTDTFPAQQVNLIESQNGSWNTLTFSFGPTYRMNYKKFGTDIYAKVGVSLLKTPSARIAHEYDFTETELFNLDKQNSVSLGVTSGIRLYYHVNKLLSFYINPQIVYNTTKVDYTIVDDLDPAFNTGTITEDPITGFDREAVRDVIAQEKSFNPAYFNLNAGLSFNIGTKDKPQAMSDSFGPTYRNKYATETEGFGPTYRDKIKEPETCYAPTLSEATNQKDYALDEKERPSFSWEENPENKTSPEKYILRLTDDKNEIIYTKETSKTNVPHTNELESIYNNYASEEIKKMYWDVESQFDDCGSQTSERTSFGIKSKSSGLDIELANITCEYPAFDSDGFVNYTGQIVFTNSPNNSNSITIPQQVFTFTDTSSGSSTDASQEPCSVTNLLMLPLILNPGESSTYCLSFKRPFGEEETALHVEYHETSNSGLLMNEIVTEYLPNCVCNVCDDWDIQATNIQLTSESGSGYSAKVFTDIKIFNSDSIREVTAEIVSLQHLANEEECYSCNKEANDMGLFYKFSGEISPNNVWRDNGQGALVDANEDTHGNKYSWRSENTGVDFSVLQKFELPLNLPEKNSLDCCDYFTSLCVRYTFTNINCESCTILICYELDK